MARRLFLERRTYRQNRLQDAARLLPVLGLILIFGPIFIRDEGAGPAGVEAASNLTGAPTLAGGLVYYFAVWLGLIVLTAVVSRAMMRASAPEPEAEAGSGGSGSGLGPELGPELGPDPGQTATGSRSGRDGKGASAGPEGP